MRGAWAGTLGALVTLSMGASCAPAEAPTMSLRVRGAPTDASVTVDDRYLGTFAYVASHGVALPAGKHRITVEKTGFFPWDRLVEAHVGDPPMALDVLLVPVPD